MRSPGKPDVSVPITWAYNHHYGQYLNGKNSVMEQIELSSFNSRANIMGHAMPGSKVWITRPADDDPNPTSKIPTSTVFATGKCGESDTLISSHFFLILSHAFLIPSHFFLIVAPHHLSHTFPGKYLI